MSLEGKQIDRYTMVRLLGSGGMGDVYLAEDPRIGQRVAIKVIRTELSPYPHEQAVRKATRLFQREAKAIVKLDHAHILPLYDYGEEHIGNAPVIYLVMPYRPEGSLTDWLRHRENKGLLDPQDVAQLVSQAADALQHAHEHQVIHQDVKPSNFLVRSREDTPTRPDLLLSDFGIAQLTTATSSVSQSIQGTPAYMAPEQWEGEPVPATDQYALAVMTYELLTGKLPFQGGPGKMMYHHINTQPQPPSSLNPLLSSDIDTVLLHALAKEPGQRFASISEFALAFQQAAQKGENSLRTLPTLPASYSDRSTKAVPPAGETGTSSTFVPNEAVSQTLIDGRDSDTYRKPVDTPVVLTPARSLHQPSERFIPTITVKAKPHTPRRRYFLLLALILLVLTSVAGASIYVLPLLVGKPATTSISGQSSNSSGTSSNAGSATVTMIPASSDLQHTYNIQAVTGTPSVDKQQVKARLLSTSTQQQSQTVNATGTQTTQGTQAHGVLTFDNGVNPAVTFTVGTIFPNDQSPNIQMVLDQTVTVPGPDRNNDGIATAPAHVLQTGSIGNVAGGTLGLNNPAFYHLINNTMQIYNVFNFTGGQDSQTVVVVQQSDIDGATNTLESANTPNAQQTIQPLVLPNERLIGTPQCKPTINSNQKAGDKATSVTVTVNFTCTGESYDYDGARSLATQLLKQQALTDPGNSYTLVGNVKTTVNSAAFSDPAQGTVSIQVNATGRWVYQLSTTQQQQFAHLIAGKNKQTALHLLLSEPGVGNVTIQLSSGDMTSLPTDPSRISFLVQNVSGI